jgi:hypothetical protein
MSFAFSVSILNPSWLPSTSIMIPSIPHRLFFHFSWKYFVSSFNIIDSSFSTLVSLLYFLLVFRKGCFSLLSKALYFFFQCHRLLFRYPNISWVLFLVTRTLSISLKYFQFLLNTFTSLNRDQESSELRSH